ncbi:hypothetical protein HDU91_001585 [Kappamyces sp. JEL0680]|nr:hypothetical protein HDU91_001585 [Kappamyces sp. JEL0680]
MPTICKLPQDLLALIGSYLTVLDYIRVRKTCKAMHALLDPQPWLRFEAYRISSSHLGRLCDASQRMRIDYRSDDNLATIALFLIAHGHQAEFTRFLHLGRFAGLPDGVKEEACNLAFHPGYAKFSRINPHICLALIQHGVGGSKEINEALVMACSVGNAAVASALLSDHRVDPSYHNHLALRSAAKSGQLAVMELLLADPRIDPTADFNYAIHWACVNNQAEVVRLLLADGRADPGANGQQCIRLACKYECHEVIPMLLADARVDASFDHNACVREAALKGRARILTMLLQLSRRRLDPGDRDNFAVRAASLNGHAECVQQLLGHRLVDPCAEGNQALLWAMEKGHVHVIRLLLADDRVATTVPRPVRFACERMLRREQSEPPATTVSVM